jgi:hypothetical protein
MPIGAENVRELLKHRIPNLTSFQIGRREIWSDSPPDNYAVFGEGLRPYIFSLLRSPGNDDELHNIFSFLEEIARTDSSALLDVLQLEIVVPLRHANVERELARKYMGNKLRELVEKSQKPSRRLWLARLLTGRTGR